MDSVRMQAPLVEGGQGRSGDAVINAGMLVGLMFAAAIGWIFVVQMLEKLK